MPILQLIVAERLGLNVSLSTAPLHVFMRYTNPTNGRSIAIESTSGGHPASEADYFEQMGVTQAQVDSGIYLGVLSKREHRSYGQHRCRMAHAPRPLQRGYRSHRRVARVLPD